MRVGEFLLGGDDGLLIIWDDYILPIGSMYGTYT